MTTVLTHKSSDLFRYNRSWNPIFFPIRFSIVWRTFTKDLSSGALLDSDPPFMLIRYCKKLILPEYRCPT
jgi:hypothetical protein